MKIESLREGGAVESLIALSLFGPWDPFAFESTDEFALGIRIIRSPSQQSSTEETCLLSREGESPPPKLPPLRAPEDFRDLAVERIQQAVERLMGDRVYSTSQDWSSVPVVDELAEALAFGGPFTLRLGLMRPTSATDSGTSSVTASTTDYWYNSPPEAYDDSYYTQHDTTINEPAPGVLWNDYDADGDTLSAVLVSGPTHAVSFTLNADGSFTYEPPPNWAGGDSFTYRAHDGYEESYDAATVGIGIMNEAPISYEDSYYTQHDVTLNVAAPGVLANDEQWDSDPMTAVLDTGPTHAVAFTLNADGSFEYAPPTNWAGSDSFTYYADDGVNDGIVHTPVTVSIGIMNEAPISYEDSYYTQHDVTLNVAAPGVLANDEQWDSDPMTAVLDTGPTHAVAFTLNADGSFEYVPQAAWAGSDSFTYYADDGVNDGVTHTAVAVDIAVMNQPPVTNDDPDGGGSYVTVIGTALEVDAPGVRVNDYDPDADPFDLVLHTPPNQGSVTLNQDGSFRYQPNAGYEGPDSFQYYGEDNIDDGVDNSLFAATVRITMVRPIPDIDTDSDNNGTIDETPYEDDEEMVDPGRILRWNTDDDNGNGVSDRTEAPLRNAAGQPVMDNELFPAKLSWDSVGADMTGCVLELSASSNLRLWKTLDKESLPLSYTVGTDTVPPEIYVEGYDLGQGTVTWTIKNPSGAAVNNDEVKFTVVLPNLTGYRPQTEGPGYGSPFARTDVPWEKETSPGVGIRLNGDDDDADGTRDFDPNDTAIAGENDLIEVEVDFASDPGVQYRLQASSQNIKAWANSNKSGEYHLDGTYVLTSPGSIWVEWVQPDLTQSADLELLVYDGTHGNLAFVGDSLHFHPFTSIVIVYGGWGSVPLDPDAGPFQMAQTLYERGYDVHAYNERTLTEADPTAAHREVISAVDERGVQQVALFGHSYGGGGVYEVLTRLGATPPQGNYTVPFTAYVDAIEWNTWTYPAETRLPPGSQYHVNYYQTNNSPQGAAVGGQVFGLDVTLTAWGAALEHTTIDNNLTVRTRILDGSTAGGIEGPHSGLTQKVNR